MGHGSKKMVYKTFGKYAAKHVIISALAGTEYEPFLSHADLLLYSFGMKNLSKYDDGRHDQRWS